ncbi:MAG TPA: hypothetical protein VL137_10695 [Polyangiaceae bacterium]|nr:hypothetical protein [Polyangiaceae bacterium]
MTAVAFRVRSGTLRAAVLLFLLVSIAGCMPSYRPPTANEPHAVIKLRRVYEHPAGTSLEEAVVLNETRALAKSSSALVSAPRTDAILVRPEPARWEVSNTFFHYENQYVREAYQVQEPYTDSETYSCGTYNSYRSCSRMVTRYRSVTRYRNVWKQVQITDAQCSAKTSHVPKDGAVYLLQYTDQGAGICNLRCYEQRGSDNVPCDAALAKQ